MQNRCSKTLKNHCQNGVPKWAKIHQNIALEATFGHWFCDFWACGAMPKHHVFLYLSWGSKSRKVGPRCGQRGTWGTKGGARVVDFQKPRPSGTAPSTRTRQKKEGDGRKKEEPRKKESGKWKKVQRDLNTPVARGLANYRDYWSRKWEDRRLAIYGCT